MRRFEADLSRSAKLFRDVVWPIVRTKFGGDLIPVESMTDSVMATTIDRRSGIDAWHLSDSERIRGVASRVQFGKDAWNSFTVRRTRPSGAKTEYEKRKTDIQSNQGWLYPFLTIQAYVDDTGPEPMFLTAAVTTTESIIQACEDIDAGRVDKRRGGIRPNKGVTFFWISWQYLVDTQRPIVIFGQQNTDSKQAQVTRQIQEVAA